MGYVVTALFASALRDAAALTLPVVIVVAAIGVIIGAIQTVAQIQDQNVSFGPKLCAVACMLALGGPAALGMLRDLLAGVVAALPQLARQ